MSETLSAFDLLEGDYQGIGLRRLQESLGQIRQSVRQTMDRGLTREEFDVAQRVLLAVETAEETANTLHEKMSR
ncbi:MAG: hypothetical protein K6G15_05980 [Desulfovibrio sp.]|nr:hypothetical protein [Desulfovibrio sp.]